MPTDLPAPVRAMLDDVRRRNAELEEHVRAHGAQLVAAYERLGEETAARVAADQAKFHLAAIVESAEDAIISKNLAGVVRSWNPGAERLFGYRADEMIGEPIARLMPAGQEDEASSILARIRRGERIEHYEAVRRRKDGTLVPVSLTISPVRDAAGAVIGASKIARDLTERRQLREQSALVVELQQALAEIKTLKGLVPICAWCKKIRDDAGFWQLLESYLREHTGAEFSHGMCPDCYRRATEVPGRP